MEYSEQIFREFNNIKVLLLLIIACLFVIACGFIIQSASIISATRAARRKADSLSKEIELEELLASDQGEAAKVAATEWITAQPKRKEAHLALAKAHYQLGELSEAKAVLKGLLAFAPDEHFHVDPWLELLDTEFAKKRPTRVE